MNTSAMHQFEPGKAYLVAHRMGANSGKPQVTRKVRRIFKGMENRFGGIPCAVFTSQADRSTTARPDWIGTASTASVVPAGTPVCAAPLR